MNTTEAPSTVTISLKEHDRLREVESAYKALTDNMETMVLEDGWYNNRRVLNPDEATKILNLHLKAWKDKYYALLNRPNKKKWYHF